MELHHGADAGAAARLIGTIASSATWKVLPTQITPGLMVPVVPIPVLRLLATGVWKLPSTIGIGTTGTINPGVIWVGNTFQVALEAIVPINRASGTGVGAMVQLHLYLDDLFPRSIGAPLLGAAANQGRPIFGN